jgi:hypothetical protein
MKNSAFDSDARFKMAKFSFEALSVTATFRAASEAARGLGATKMLSICFVQLETRAGITGIESQTLL